MPFESILDNFFSSQRPMFSLSRRVWNPPTDIYENSEATFIKIEVAGLDESQMRITADHNLLVVRGQRMNCPASEPAQEKVNYHLMEIHYGQFERVFAFSFTLDESSIKATYERGFIVIEVRKNPARVTHVSVQVIQDEYEK
jgi:HSP20 family protein